VFPVSDGRCNGFKQVVGADPIGKQHPMLSKLMKYEGPNGVPVSKNGKTPKQIYYENADVGGRGKNLKQGLHRFAGRMYGLFSVQGGGNAGRRWQSMKGIRGKIKHETSEGGNDSRAIGAGVNASTVVPFAVKQLSRGGTSFVQDRH